MKLPLASLNGVARDDGTCNRGYFSGVAGFGADLDVGLVVAEYGKVFGEVAGCGLPCPPDAPPL
jgi:hypothetical protein